MWWGRLTYTPSYRADLSGRVNQYPTTSTGSSCCCRLWQSSSLYAFKFRPPGLHGRWGCGSLSPISIFIPAEHPMWWPLFLRTTIIPYVWVFPRMKVSSWHHHLKEKVKIRYIWECFPTTIIKFLFFRSVIVTDREYFANANCNWPI